MTDASSAARRAPEGLDELIVSKHVHCLRCGYDLVGLSHRSSCPECGLDIWATVTHMVDPAASRLPRLRKPARVGNGLVALTLCVFAAVLLQAVPAIAKALDGAGRLPFTVKGHAPDWLGLASIVPGFLGLLAVFAIAHPPPEEPARRVMIDLRMLSLGLLGWASLAGSAPLTTMLDADPNLQIVARLAAAPFSFMALFGLRGLLQTIGQRSRAYRRSRGGRQSVDALIGAQVARVLGMSLMLAGKPASTPNDFGRVLVWASGLLFIIGLLYLIRNAWMIRASLLRPPPGLNEVVTRAPPAGA